MRQEAAVHAEMQQDEAQHGRVTRSMSTVRLFVDATRAEEQVRSPTQTLPCLALAVNTGMLPGSPELARSLPAGSWSCLAQSVQECTGPGALAWVEPLSRLQRSSTCHAH